MNLSIKENKEIKFLFVTSLLLYILFFSTVVFWLLVLIAEIQILMETGLNFVKIVVIIILIYFCINPLIGIFKIRKWKNLVIKREQRLLQSPIKTLLFVALVFVIILFIFTPEDRSFGGGFKGLFITIILSIGTGLSTYRSLDIFVKKIVPKITKRQKFTN